MLAAAERTFPVLAPVPVVDAAPLVRAPQLAQVPVPERARRAARPAGLAVSLGILAVGLAGVAAGRPRRAGAR